jgi:hypothetical protein
MSEKTYEPLPGVDQFLKDYAATGLVPATHKTLTSTCGCPLGAYAQARAKEGNEVWGRAIAAQDDGAGDDIIDTAQNAFGKIPVRGFINGFDYPSDEERPDDRRDPEFMKGRERGKAVNAAVFAPRGHGPRAICRRAPQACARAACRAALGFRPPTLIFWPASTL